MDDLFGDHRLPYRPPVESFVATMMSNEARELHSITTENDSSDDSFHTPGMDM
jgi:hypothetical protein